MPHARPSREAFTPPRVACIAHRGASATAPENTVAAVREAIHQGADTVEVDVQRTRDGALVAVHDQRLARTTDVVRQFPRRLPWDVGSFTLTELQRLDAGRSKGSTYAGERIPTLDHVLDELRDTGVGLLLEVKAPHLYPGIAADVAETVRTEHQRSGPPTRITVQSFDWSMITELHLLAPRTPVGLLGRAAATSLPSLTWAQQINPRYGSVDATWIRTARDLGLGVHVWTVDDPLAMQQAIADGVSGIITNRPNLLSRVRASHQPHAGRSASDPGRSQARRATPSHRRIAETVPDSPSIRPSASKAEAS